MRLHQPLILLFFALLSGTAARADILLYQVDANLSAFTGNGTIGLSLNTFGLPDFNVTATVRDLSLPGSTVTPGQADPDEDVEVSGNTIRFGGVSSNRNFIIPVVDFGSSLRFLLELERAAGGSRDGWTFSVFAQDEEGSVFDALFLDLGPDGEPFLFSSDAFSAAVVPEPSTWAMLAAAVAGVAYRVRRRRAA